MRSVARLALVVRVGLGVAAVLVAAPSLGCPRGSTELRPPAEGDSSGADAGADSGETGEDGPVAEACGEPNERFGDYDWVPVDSPLATTLERSDPTLAGALSQLRGLVDSDGGRLPIRVALDYRSLGFQLLGIEAVLAELELDPAELVELHSPSGDVVWLWPTRCSASTLAARLLGRLGVMLRADFTRPTLRIGASSDRFPFDVVLVHEGLIGLAPRGRGAPVGAWLSSPPVIGEGPGAALANIEAAPIRSVLGGPSLLGVPDPSSATPSANPLRTLRVTATAWEELHDPTPPNDAPP